MANDIDSRNHYHSSLSKKLNIDSRIKNKTNENKKVRIGGIKKFKMRPESPLGLELTLKLVYKRHSLLQIVQWTSAF